MMAVELMGRPIAHGDSVVQMQRVHFDSEVRDGVAEMVGNGWRWLCSLAWSQYVHLL